MSKLRTARRKYYFEDFSPGDVWEMEGPAISKEEIVDFASRYDPQYFHTDEDAAQHSPYGGLIASGWHTVSLCMRMVCDRYLLDAVSHGSPGVSQIRWLRPVRPGDSLKLKMTVLEAKISRSKPDRGSVTHRWEVFNQDGEMVMSLEGVGILARRQHGTAA
jgi:acyl dehydratase